MPSDPEPETIEAIIERDTVDAYGDEGHTSFLCAFEDEVDYPIAATLAGAPITISNVDYDGHPARGLVGAIANDSGHHRVALIELTSKAGFRAGSSPPTVAGSASIHSHRLVHMGLMSPANADQIAHEFAHQLGSLGFGELAGRTGHIPGRGYVDENEAAWELLEEALEPFLNDIRRRAALGFTQAAAAIATGTIAGLDRLRETPDGQLIAFAGDDAVDTLADTVVDLADNFNLKSTRLRT